MSLYSNSLWINFRESVIELDDNRCTVCGRSRDEVVLQVHHKRYIIGRKPWEYTPSDCKTLCKGCHAAEHGIIMPKFGWEYMSDEDLGDLIGTCDNCGSSLRYLFYIYHEKWGTIGVGTLCCDNLTDSEVASNLVESKKKYEERKKRFIESKRWKHANDIRTITQNGFEIEIQQCNDACYIKVNQLRSEKKYKSLFDAQSKIFDVIESGELINYVKKKNITLESTNNKKRKTINASR